MYTPFIILCLQTLIFWLIVIILHRKKNKITLIPLYTYIALLTVMTHNFSDLGFAVVINQWFFLISSFSFFTTLMFGTLYLYLFEGPRAGRLALWVILFSSFFYIAIVYFLNLIIGANNWIHFDSTRTIYYFWSILAIIIDVIFLAIAWELLSRIKSLNLLTRVFLITFAVFALDTIVFTSGAFGGSNIYPTMLKGDLLIRLILSLIGAPLITYSLKSEGFAEEKRDKPKNFWEILNFHSDLEIKIESLEQMIAKQKILEKEIQEAGETYRLAITGTGAGIWDWDVITNKIIWSPKFCSLLGYTAEELKGNLDAFKEILHPEDTKRTFDLVDRCFKDGTPFEIEYRLKNKTGEYRWFLASGTTKYNDNKKPIRMVGSIIDINTKKEDERVIKEKINQLTELNNIMVGREIKMIELKKEIDKLKKDK